MRRVNFGRRERPVHITIATIFRALGPIGIRAPIPRVFVHRHAAALAELVHYCASPLVSQFRGLARAGNGRLEREKRTGGVVRPAFELRAMALFAPQRMHSREKCEAQLSR